MEKKLPNVNPEVIQVLKRHFNTDILSIKERTDREIGIVIGHAEVIEYLRALSERQETTVIN